MSRAKEHDNKWDEVIKLSMVEHPEEPSIVKTLVACKESDRQMNHKTLDDVKELFIKTIPKITDKEYQGIEDGFKHYGIDCKLGREKFLTELEKQKIK